MKYLIWSNEHKMWWRANECGYTENRLEAGKYDLDEAIMICFSGTHWQDAKMVPGECMVPNCPEWDENKEQHAG